MKKEFLTIQEIVDYRLAGKSGIEAQLLFTTNRNRITRYIRNGVRGRKLPAKQFPSLLDYRGNRYEVRLADALEFRKFLASEMVKKGA